MLGEGVRSVNVPPPVWVQMSTEQDMNRLFEWAAFDPRASGVYIASAPTPVSQVEFMAMLRRAVGLPAPEMMVRLGAKWLMRTDPELALYGRYVISRRLREEGFAFRFPSLDGALNDLVGAPAD